MKSISCVAVFCFVICAIANAMDYPVRDQSVNVSNSGADVIWFGYTPAQKTNNFWEFYYVSNGIQYRVISTDGKSWVLDNFVNAVRSEAIVKKDNIWYMGYHTRDAINVYFNTTQSSDGINFPTGTQRFPSGEDMSFTIINDSFYCYIRPLAPHAEPRRRVGLMKSKDFVSWTPIIPILEVDSINYNNPYSADYRKQFYKCSGQVQVFLV